MPQISPSSVSFPAISSTFDFLSSRPVYEGWGLQGRDIYTYLVIMKYSLYKKDRIHAILLLYFSLQKNEFVLWQPTQVINMVYFFLFKVSL